MRFPAHARRICLGSTGRWPVVAGNIDSRTVAKAKRNDPVSAGCRDLQGGSLRSPARANMDGSIAIKLSASLRK
jgi:hypothetical protein